MNSKKTNILLVILIIIAIAILTIQVTGNNKYSKYGTSDLSNYGSNDTSLNDSVNQDTENLDGGEPEAASNTQAVNTAYVVGKKYTTEYQEKPINLTYKGLQYVAFNATYGATRPVFTTDDGKYFVDQHALLVNMGTNTRSQLEGLNEPLGATISEGQGGSYTVNVPEDQNIFDAAAYYESSGLVKAVNILWYGPKDADEI